MKISSELLCQIERLFDQYRAEVNGTELTDNAKKSYIGYVDMFVRWTKDDFVPGAKLKKQVKNKITK